MKANRTFGIEIEMHSTRSQHDNAQAIRDAFEANGIAHSVVVTSYGHDTDASNVTGWKIKPDGSLRDCPRSLRNQGYHIDMDLEVVSPVLKGDEGIKILKVVCDSLQGHVKVSRACGLHVHHGINPNERMHMTSLVNSWIDCEQHFFSVLPESRQNNGFAKKYSKRNNELRGSYGNDRIERMRKANPNESLKDWYKKMLSSGYSNSDRYLSLNLESYWLRSTVELRLHSGTHEFEKMKNWLEFTQEYTDRALKNNVTFNSDFFKFVNQFKTERTVVEGSNLRSVNNSNPTIFHPHAPVQRMPRAGSMNKIIIDCMLEGMTLSAIAEKLRVKTGDYSRDFYSYVKGRISRFQSLKAQGMGLNVSVGYMGEYKIIPYGGEVEQEREYVDGPAVGDALENVAWMKARHLHFNPNAVETNEEGGIVLEHEGERQAA